MLPSVFERWAQAPLSLKLLLGFALGGPALSACEEARPADPKPRPASPGWQQGSADGPTLSEQDACELYRDALQTQQAGLSCDFELLPCPGLIYAGGSLACSRFSEASVQHCTEQISEYSSCAEFTTRRCILTSVVDEVSEGCVPPGSVEAGADAGSSSGTPEAGPTTEPLPPEAGPTTEPLPSEAGTGANPGAEAGVSDGGGPQPDAAPTTDTGSSDAAVSSTSDAASGVAAEGGAAVDAQAAAEAGADAAP